MSEENTTPDQSTEMVDAGMPDADPSADKTYTEDQVQNLLKALRSQRETTKIEEKKRKEAEAALDRFKDVNPEEYRKLQEENAIAAREKAAADERSQLLEEKYSKQAVAALEEKDRVIAEMMEFKKRAALEKVFFSAGGKTDMQDGTSFFDLLADKIGHNFRLETNGTVTVVDAQGDPVLDKESGRRIDPTEFIKSYKTHPIYGTFFKGVKGAGAGLGYGGTGVNGVVGDDVDDLSGEELFLRAYS